MVDASCHSFGIQNFEVAPEKICAHTNKTTTMKTTATAAKKF